MIRAHKNAVLARLREDSILAGSTFDGEVTNRPSRYCAVYVDNGFRQVERLTGGSRFADFSITVHSVGSTAEQAQLVAERVFAQLLDWTPTITGRISRRVRHQASRAVQMDTDVDPALYYAVDVFGLTTAPA